MYSSPSPSNSSVGSLLAHWRKLRQKSQLSLANRAGVSPRHLCFVETGRSKPSREMVMLLAETLDIPLRERNALLLAAGFAPVFAETPLDAPALSAVQRALQAILRQQEPYPAVVMNRHWDIVSSNGAATRFFSYMLAGSSPPDPSNVVRLMLDPLAMRPHVRNWREVAVGLYHRVRRETSLGIADAKTQKLMDDMLAFPNVKALLRDVDLHAEALPVIPITFARHGKEPTFQYFSTVTTLGTPQDITLQELRIECFFPADVETEKHARALRA